MSWEERIIAVHTAVTDQVSHAKRLNSDRYFVWQEEGGDDLLLDGRHLERGQRGTTDLFTKREFDPWKDDFEKALDAERTIDWYLNSTQYEEDTGFFHYEWVWSVRYG
jgi:hypothetical protein